MNSSSLNMSDDLLKLCFSFVKSLQVYSRKATNKRNAACLLYCCKTSNIVSYGYDDEEVSAEAMMFSRLSFFQRKFSSKSYILVSSHFPSEKYCHYIHDKTKLRNVFYENLLSEASSGIRFLRAFSEYRILRIILQ